MRNTAVDIRPAGFEHAEAIFALVKLFPDQLLPRAIPDIVQNIDRFLVCIRDDDVAGCISWQVLPELGRSHHPAVEIKSLSVSPRHQGNGIGRALVEEAITRVRPLHPERVIVLTFTPSFFKRLGFREVPKEQLMHKLYMGCISCTKHDNPFTCPEVAMVQDLTPVE
jgi:amino-acid N-acetyltransferase